MPRSSRPTRAVRATALAGALIGVLAACGGEPEVRDDGTQGVPLAGRAAQLESAGVEVLSAEQPSGATGADVAAALEAQQLGSAEVADLADLSAGVGGLVTARGDASRFVLLVFDDPASAALFADDADDTGAVLTADGPPETYLAGNVVGVAHEHGALVRRALRDLAGGG